MSSRAKIDKLLDSFIAKHPLPGLWSRSNRGRFIKKLLESQVRLRALRMRTFTGSTDPNRDDFHPYSAIIQNFEKGNPDETIWLAFLCTHFGWDPKSRQTRDTIRLFYGKFGHGLWDWKTISGNPAKVRDWMRQNPEEVKQLKFSNHRKYETNNPESPVGTAAVISSFVKWAKTQRATSLYEAFMSRTAHVAQPEAAFDFLFCNFDIRRFERTARFDFLCLLGNLRLLPVAPGHCYLRGATGPKAGVVLMITGKKQGKLTRETEGKISELRKHLGIPSESLEDALCNWQKRKGFLSVTCS